MEHFYAHPGVYRWPKGGDSPRSRGAYRKDLWRWVKYYDQAEVGVTRDATESGGNLTALMTMYRAVGMRFYVTKAVAEVRGCS